MTALQIVEVVAGMALIAVAVVLYRRQSARGAGDGSQSAILLIVAAALLLVHGLGFMSPMVRSGWL